jgi:L-fuconolactonase
MPDEHWLAKAAPEQAVEPELPIIDAHLHSWHRGDYRYFVEEYARDAAASGHKIVATVAAECGAMYRASGPEHLRPVGETGFLVGMGAMADSGKYTATRVAASIVAFADLTLGERTREALQAHRDASNGRLGGIRHAAKWDPDPAVPAAIGPGRPGLYLEAAFRQGLAMAASMDLAFEASIYHPQIADVVALARAHPDARIVLIHSGTPLGIGSYAGRQAEVHAQWLAGMRDLAQCPNVSIKLGGLLMFLGSFDPKATVAPPDSSQLAEFWRPYIEPCIELFGAARCMAAANFPVDKMGVPYGTMWNMFKRITAGCSADEKRLIYHDTARQVYNMRID